MPTSSLTRMSWCDARSTWFERSWKRRREVTLNRTIVNKILKDLQFFRKGITYPSPIQPDTSLSRPWHSPSSLATRCKFLRLMEPVRSSSNKRKTLDTSYHRERAWWWVWLATKVGWLILSYIILYYLILYVYLYIFIIYNVCVFVL